jgi:hypothetical protein
MIEDLEYSKFNPNDIDISVQQISLYYLLRRLEYGEIDLFARYQRNWNLWTHMQQSRLIESILIKIPLPAFYFNSLPNGNWQVVDGLQRVSTIFNYIIESKFSLSGLEFLPEYNGYRFSELPRELQRRIEEFSLTIYLINKQTPEDVKFAIFSRINTGGINLNSQELRYGLNQGRATDLLIELAESSEFKEATYGKVLPRRMQHFELVNRFLGFFLYKDQYTGNLDSFLNQTLVYINQSEDEFNDIKTSFYRAMRYSIKIFGENRFKKINPFSTRSEKFSKVLFDTIAVNLAWLSEEKLLILERNKDLVQIRVINLFMDSLFVESTSFTTNNRRKVDYRFEVIYELFKQIYNDY